VNILFLTLLDFDSLDNRNLYTDLMREFCNNGHNLFLVSPIEEMKKSEEAKKSEKTKNENANKYIKYSDNCVILKPVIGKIQKVNLVKKFFTTITLQDKIMKIIKEYTSDVKFDLVMYSTPPVTFNKVVDYIKTRDSAKSYLLLKDIFPQNAVDLGIIKTFGVTQIIYKYFRKKEIDLYKVSDYIGCMSEKNVEFVLKHNDIGDKCIEVCPNSIEPAVLDENIDKIALRKKFDLPDDKFIFVYGGNLGKPQGLDFLSECIDANKNNENIFFIIAGSGTEYPKVKKYFDDSNPKNAVLLSFLPKAEFDDLLKACDVGLIFLDKRFTIPNFPSRLLSYMEYAMPVIAVTDKNTDIGDVIVNGEFGFWCESGDIDSFNNITKEICGHDIIGQMGTKSRKYLEDNYTAKESYKIIIKHFEK